MKRIILIGPIGCGKTTLRQEIQKTTKSYKKTQTIEYFHDIIDTPGEYIENRNYYSALIVSSVDCDVIGLTFDCSRKYYPLPPNIGPIFLKPVIGIVTKVDLCNEEDLKIAEQRLKISGAERIFKVSSKTGQGIEELREYLYK